MNKATIFLLFTILFLTLSCANSVLGDSTVTYSGRLIDKNSNPINGSISFFDSVTGALVDFNQTDQDGNYLLSLQTGVYDIKYNLTSIDPNLYIRLHSVNVTSDIVDMANLISKNITNGELSFNLNITSNQTVEIYSATNASRITENGAEIKWAYYPANKKLSFTANVSIPVLNCSDGTQNGKCSFDKPKYCDNGNLIDKCSVCNCSTGYNCLANENCNLTKMADYTITGINGVYTGTENINPYRSTSSSNAATVITTMFGWMSAGQRVEFIGTFNWGSEVDIEKNITIDWSKATINFTTALYPIMIKAQVTINGGHTVHVHAPVQDYDPPNNGGHLIGGVINSDIYLYTGATKTVLDGLDFKNFGLWFLGEHQISNVTIQNCIFHDRKYVSGSPLDDRGMQCIELFETGGYNIIQDCRFLNITGLGIDIQGRSTHNQFLRIEVAGQEMSQAMYLSGGLTAAEGVGGYNIIANSIFHDAIDYPAGAIQIKCPHNIIRNNTFYNGQCTAISIYSQWDYSQANDNEIYNNTFKDMPYSAIWIGAQVDTSQTLRNIIYNNTFINIGTTHGYDADCIRLTGITSAATDDTKIYYNDFSNISWLFRSDTPALVHNTVFAYNYIDAATSPTELQSMVNSMSYQNTYFPPNDTLAMANFNYSNITNPASWYYVAPRT